MRAVLLLAFAALTCASLACRDRDTGTPTPTAALPTATAPDATATTSRGTTPTASPSPTSTAPAGVLDPGTHEHTLESGGRGRRYLVHVPPGPPGSLPVVMVLHGGGGNANQVIRSTRFDEVADENGFIAVFPHGSGRLSDEFLLTWNSGNCCGYARAQDIDDVAFLRAVVEAVLRDYGADARRVYVTGMSNGGMMSYRLACEASGVFAAAAPVAGALNVDCNPGQPVSLLAIHGTGDRMVRYEGGEPLEQVDPASRIDTSVADSVGFFVAHNACAEPPATTMDGILRYDEWGSCDQNARVALYTIEGGVHEWPGDQVATVGREVDASRLIWQFFAALPPR